MTEDEFLRRLRALPAPAQARVLKDANLFLDAAEAVVQAAEVLNADAGSWKGLALAVRLNCSMATARKRSELARQWGLLRQ